MNLIADVGDSLYWIYRLEPSCFSELYPKDLVGIPRFYTVMEQGAIASLWPLPIKGVKVYRVEDIGVCGR